MSNEKTYYVIAKSKRAARRAANADPRWQRTWISDREMALVLIQPPFDNGSRVYSFKVRADVESVELVR
jgi:hypothetical protein